HRRWYCTQECGRVGRCQVFLPCLTERSVRAFFCPNSMEFKNICTDMVWCFVFWDAKIVREEDKRNAKAAKKAKEEKRREKRKR
ncbi:MAG: hypothetical protein ACI9YB_003356, partial [Halioglobus sp.]